MKISNDQVQQILQAAGTKGVGKAHRAQGSGAVAKADGAALSDASQDISKALALVSSTPDVRADKVAALKAQIQAGTYRPTGDGIAQAILERSKAEALF
jgi:negative regulator of flagellin synthesis FlgM